MGASFVLKNNFSFVFNDLNFPHQSCDVNR
ncbi:hypothetical protein EMIT0P253_20298 [Pseudomonas sp. IT-P253]